MNHIPQVGEHAIYADSKQFSGKIVKVRPFPGLEGHYAISIILDITPDIQHIAHTFAVTSDDWYDPMQSWISIPEEHRHEWVINIFNTALVRVSGDASI